ncbi:MAG: hydroxyacylglutathione hydrolase [bacterium]
MSLAIKTIPAFDDNYIWLAHDSTSNKAIVVDPGDAAPVIKSLDENGLSLGALLITHQHPDHIGGVSALLERYPNLIIYGPADISLVTHPVKDGDIVHFGSTVFDVLAVPGHTLNHLAFYSAEEDVLFCGDTLFAGGCGRLFEGTPEQMYRSLQKLAALPDQTQIFCAHEYTLANLKFASAVEPENRQVALRLNDTEKLRLSGKPSVPSTMGLERQTNPFLRSDSPELKQRVEAQFDMTCDDQVSVFAVTRRWKDNF